MWLLLGCLKQHMQMCRPCLAAVPVVLASGCPASLAARCYALSLSRVCTPRFALGDLLLQRPILPPKLATTLLNHHPTFRHLTKCLISSSVECRSFREKSEGIINQGSHRRRHVTLGWGPDCHQPVQTKHCWSKCALSCVSSG